MKSEPQKRSSRFYEDYVVGSVLEIGTLSYSQEEIIDFARIYDPQPMHVDPNFASTGPYGEIIASGWQTLCSMMRLFVTNYLDHSNIGSPGMSEITFDRPVRAGDMLTASVLVEDARISRSKPDRGIVSSKVTITNQRDETIITLKLVNIIMRRNND